MAQQDETAPDVFIYEFVGKIEKIRNDSIQLECGTHDINLWTIEGFTNLSEDIIYSPPFHTHSEGYFMRLLICPKGFNNTNVTERYVSIYFEILRDEFGLVFPMRNKIRIGIFNQTAMSCDPQSNYKEYSYDETPEVYQNKFQRPIGAHNQSCGHDHFFEFKDIDSELYIVHDKIAIFCYII